MVQEVGDFQHCVNPRQFLVWLGLAPRKHCTSAQCGYRPVT
ncbi:transposase [Phyllobacterium myrsinacearum]